MRGDRSLIALSDLFADHPRLWADCLRFRSSDPRGRVGPSGRAQ